MDTNVFTTMLSDAATIITQVFTTIEANKVTAAILGLSLFGLGCKAFRKLKRSVN